MPHLKLKSIRKSYGGFDVLKGIDLEIERGKFIVFVGPSGCGKSTLLRSIAGLEEISEGEIHLGGRRIDLLEPADRKVAMVFQNYALYPHMTVGENMSFGLRLARVGKNIIRDKVRQAADILQISDYLDRKPKALSGGQRQRVAIGRAIVREPELFLFDEPLSNLDAKLRVQMRLELTKLHRQLGATMIYVTHDQVEAMTMADQIVILNAGHIEQIGTPLELYRNPCNTFVAGFIGSPAMNFLSGVIHARNEEATTVRLASGTDITLPVVCPPDIRNGATVTVGIRPEALTMGTTGSAQFQVEVDAVERLGSETYVYAKSLSGEAIALHTAGDEAVAYGQSFSIQLDARRCHLFSEDGQSIGAGTK